MPRVRLTPPKFCGVRMSGNDLHWTVLVGVWRCSIKRAMCGHHLADMKHNGIKLRSLDVRGGAQACANAAERWMQSVGIDALKLAGRRAQ